MSSRWHQSVAGRITELPVDDNKYVHKGDLLMVIDPTNYRIAVNQADAAIQQAQASVQNVDAQMDVQQAQINATQAHLDQERAALVFAQEQASRYATLAEEGSGSVQNAQQYGSQLHQREAAVHSAQSNLHMAQRQVVSLKAQRMNAEADLAQAKAKLDQTQVDLERTRILSPVNGYVTNFAGATRRLRQCRRKRHLGCQRRLILGRRIFRGNEPRSYPRGRSGPDQAHGLQSDRTRP
jgi:multidrug resistance efflux pump